MIVFQQSLQPYKLTDRLGVNSIYGNGNGDGSLATQLQNTSLTQPNLLTPSAHATSQKDLQSSLGLSRESYFPSNRQFDFPSNRQFVFLIFRLICNSIFCLIGNSFFSIFRLIGNLGKIMLSIQVSNPS